MSKMFVATSKKLFIVTALAIAASVSAWSEEVDVASYADCRGDVQGEQQRRRPGRRAAEKPACDESGVRPVVYGDVPAFAVVPDRWRIVSALGYAERCNRILPNNTTGFIQLYYPIICTS